MKLSSKSLLSPGRVRDPPASLSNSLSRRLRNSGSLKGGQASPMFPTGGKKRGCAFDNPDPEPSSPKVTCIGQVRVKSKKKERKKMATTLSRRRDGDVNFHEGINQSHHHHHHPSSCQIDGSNQYGRLNQRNQKWVHLPLTICEALRAFGAEFSCLFPCRSSEREREWEENGRGSNGPESSCGAVFGRWLVALQDDGGGKERDIESVVGGEEERRELRHISLRRHAVEEAEIVDEKWVVEEEEEGRVSICIPPKNALLLMRCISDPMRVSALANRFWEPPIVPREEDEDGVDEEDAERDQEEPQVDIEGGEVESESKMEDTEHEERERWVSDHEEEEKEENIVAETELVMKMHEDHPDEKLEINEDVQEENMVVDGCSIEPLEDQETIKPEEEAMLMQEVEREESHSRCAILSVQSDSRCEEDEVLAEFPALEEEEEGEEAEKSVEEKVTQERSEAEEDTQENHEDEKQGIQTEAEERERHAEIEIESEVKKQERESSVSPDCLMLMMAEPKLSTEVSKETWVCGTDFIRWLPERRVNRKEAGGGGGDRPKKSDSKPALHQLPRSSCSFPATVELSMATLTEKKLVNPVACEPFVLTRCKSEPMKAAAAAAKLAPQSCFWKNSKFEPHCGVMFGVGAAGLGF